MGATFAHFYYIVRCRPLSRLFGGGVFIKVFVKEYPRDKPYLTLYPIGDVHWGSKECMEDAFKAYLKVIENDPCAGVLLLGDLVNNGTKSSVSNVYEELYAPSRQKEMMIDLLRPISDKIIAGVTGNHERRSAKDVDNDITRDIFSELGIRDRYCGDAGFIKILLGQKVKDKKQVAYMVYLSHGSGGGSLLGSGVSRADGYQLSIEGVDISCSGHTHKPMKVPSARLIFDPYRNEIRRANTLIFVCTSWLDYGGYGERLQMKATAFYPDTIRLDGAKKRWS